VAGRLKKKEEVLEGGAYLKPWIIKYMDRKIADVT
jgi:hypothetical protein